MKLMKTTTLVALTAALALSGCVTDATTGQNKISKTALYGLGGAATCGIVGALTHGGKGARNSALACGAVGAGVGGYMDYQEKKLREQLQGSGVAVDRQGDQIKLTMPAAVTFATNSATLSAQAQNSLSQAAQTLATSTDTTITTVAHTDNTGNDAINNPLSVNRAASARDYLVARGVQVSRIMIDGRGSRDPIADNNTQAGRAQNRRVEIYVGQAANPQQQQQQGNGQYQNNGNGQYNQNGGQYNNGQSGGQYNTNGQYNNGYQNGQRSTLQQGSQRNSYRNGSSSGQWSQDGTYNGNDGYSSTIQ